jgi:hypothetical protein
VVVVGPYYRHFLAMHRGIVEVAPSDDCLAAGFHFYLLPSLCHEKSFLIFFYSLHFIIFTFSIFFLLILILPLRRIASSSPPSPSSSSYSSSSSSSDMTITSLRSIGDLCLRELDGWGTRAGLSDLRLPAGRELGGWLWVKTAGVPFIEGGIRSASFLACRPRGRTLPGPSSQSR